VKFGLQNLIDRGQSPQGLFFLQIQGHRILASHQGKWQNNEYQSAHQTPILRLEP
jgi:hypothetical protein